MSRPPHSFKKADITYTFQGADAMYRFVARVRREGWSEERAEILYSLRLMLQSTKDPNLAAFIEQLEWTPLGPR